MQTPIVATQISTNKDTLLNSPSGICIFTKYKLGEKTIGQNTPIKIGGAPYNSLIMKFV